MLKPTAALNGNAVLAVGHTLCQACRNREISWEDSIRNTVVADEAIGRRFVDVITRVVPLFGFLSTPVRTKHGLHDVEKRHYEQRKKGDRHLHRLDYPSGPLLWHGAIRRLAID